MHIILSHENADFDAVASLLAAHRLHPEAVPVLPAQQNRNVAAFLALYLTALPFVPRQDLDMSQVTQITLVDTQRLPQVKGLSQDIPVLVIDHHPVTTQPEPRFTLSGEVLGSTTTLLVEEIHQRGVVLEPLEATLLALGIYEDTGSLTYGNTTPRDMRAAAWLLENHAALDTIRRFLEPALNPQQQALFEQLIAHVDARQIHGYTVIVAAARADGYVDEIASVAHRLRETLDPAALFLLVDMPSVLQLVCRSTTDAIDVGKVARHFGGGGHERAAAASLHDSELGPTVLELWTQIEGAVQPAIRVSDLMSYGVQTVTPDARLSEVVGQLRRIGHEGYPVVKNERIVGLLTRRDMDRAIEHGLGNMTVREVMTAGETTLRPDDSIQTLEQVMVESGWGQIPVVDDQSRILGIVTRTDLIKHWASAHPPQREPDHKTLSLADVESVLGEPVARLIGAIAGQAQALGLNLYLVGGVVRDLVLGRPNLDVDFVVEGGAIPLADQLRSTFGGEVHAYRPFGTAKWLLDPDAARALRLSAKSLPDHIDFATARNEFYEHPTALPTVYSGSIKLDLGRRDFTINTLAVQFSPAGSAGRILDFYGGMRDLRNGLIRVLHNLSFVDDPTRMLRAVRFEVRLGFTIEARTMELMQTALPMLRRITGERVRNELNLLLREQEPARGMRLLQERQMLAAIHPAFTIQPTLEEQFRRARTQAPPWPVEKLDIVTLYWHVIAAGIFVDQLRSLLDRLLFPQQLGEALLATAELVQEAEFLRRPETRPSELDARLARVPDASLFAAWLLCEETLVRQRIEQYVREWRATRGAVDGNMLKHMGLKPGPCYGLLLGRLRAARLDGDITTDQEEFALLERLLEEGECDDRA